MTVISSKTHPTAIHFAYRAPLCGEIFTFKPAMSRSSIVTAERELKHAATVPRLAAKILRNKIISLKLKNPEAAVACKTHPATKSPTKNRM